MCYILSPLSQSIKANAQVEILFKGRIKCQELEMGKYRDGIFHGSLCCVVLLWLGILDGAKQRKVESCTGIDLGRF